MYKIPEDIVLSAFQKEIRRGSNNCLFWARQLEDKPDLLWKKIQIIGSEDIGIACPAIQTYIHNQKIAFDQTDDLWLKHSIMLNTVNYMIKQNKSRICDNVNHAYFKDVQPEVLYDQLSDWLIEFNHSLKIKDHVTALKYASHIYKSKHYEDLINSLRNPIDTNSTILIELFSNYHQIAPNKTDVLFLSHLILYRCFDQVKNIDVEDLSMTLIKQLYEDHTIPEINDYVFDKHTDIGKELNRGFEHFYEHGCVLKNCLIDDPFEPIARKLNCEKN